MHPHLRMRNGEIPATGQQRRTALLLVDVINDMEFEGSEAPVRQAEPMARRLHDLKRRARAAGLPAIYISDNVGKWRSDFRTLVKMARVMKADVRPSTGLDLEKL